MQGRNLLIGFGEKLTSEIPRDGGGGKTKPGPYTIEVARQRLGPQIRSTIAAIDELPQDAKPGGDGSGLFTIHPNFLSKYKLPNNIWNACGLRPVGSRAVKVIPGQESRSKPGLNPKLAAQLYVTGSKAAFASLLDALMSDDTNPLLKDEFCRIESVRVQTSGDRLVAVDGNDVNIPVELVLHAEQGNEELLKALDKYIRSFGGTLALRKKFSVPGLTFLPGQVPRDQLEQVAKFSQLRALRRMPKLRLNRPTRRDKLDRPVPILPNVPPTHAGTRVAVFDGGMGTSDFQLWATEHIPVDLMMTHADYLTHGTEVTSALLFGEIAEGCTELSQPLFSIDHYRVIGALDEQDADLYDCMNRVDAILKQGDVSFANLSLGPRMNIDDDHPHAWTCMLDRHLAAGKCLATVAVGNDGENPGELGRIQPPADAVNALAVGAASSNDFMWDRAAYSCTGPGRSPGLIKPDGVCFGGSSTQPLELYSPYVSGISGVQGTSFSAPLALRVAAAAAATTETPLSATALRALMIHRAERHTSHGVTQVGWGRFPGSVEALLTCENNEATVLYQGHLEAGKPLRAQLPIPSVPMGTQISIKATFCFASPVDPADSLNYTRHGLTIVFRPRGEGSVAPFFSNGSYSDEGELRRDAHKWETVLHRSTSIRAEELLGACFDVQHGARERGRKVNNKQVAPLPYVLVATITSDTAEPVYNKVLERYRMLAPIRLRQRIDV